jgi:predicted nucleotidyltransferase component of viral defense system
MINRIAIQQRVREWGLAEQVVEKDYVLGWVLWGIGTDPMLRTRWAFKGGTCLKKCYIETYRFSEDLDFTVLPEGPLNPAEVLPLMTQMLDRVGEESGIAFDGRPPTFRVRAEEGSVEGRIYYRGPRQTREVASIKLDLTLNETVVRPTVLMPIAHPYSPEKLPAPGTVRCYDFDELFAEKIRAMGQRSRPRDLYDIVNLFWRRDLRAQPAQIRAALEEKCRTKGIVVPTYEALVASPFRAELESEWENMLRHQLPMLPPFALFWNELPTLFDWLHERLALQDLNALPAGTDEATWVPPATIWTWGEGVPLEAIRFAGANHLCVALGYGGRTRLIEPYSLRRTRSGLLLLYALHAGTADTHAYRVDRITSVMVTDQPFQPKFAVEFARSEWRGHLVSEP